MQFLVILFFSLFLFVQNVYPGPLRVDADQIRNPAHTKLWTLPSTTDTLVGKSTVDTLVNKVYQQINSPEQVDAASTGSNATLPSITSSAIKLTNGSLVSIDGIPAPANGNILNLINKTGVSITINNETGATAANRIVTGTSSNISMADGSMLNLYYSISVSRWYVTNGATSAGTLGVTSGGTGLTSTTLGSLLIGSTTNAYASLPIGASTYVLTSNGSTATWQVPASGTSSYVRVSSRGATGSRGSTNTTVRIFPTIEENAGAAITYATSATLGDSFTINETGEYSIIYMDTINIASSFLAITKNGTELTTAAESLSTTATTMISYCNSGVNGEATCSASVHLTAGDVIRAQCQTSMVNSGGTRSQFQIYKR